MKSELFKMYSHETALISYFLHLFPTQVPTCGLKLQKEHAKFFILSLQTFIELVLGAFAGIRCAMNQ